MCVSLGILVEKELDASFEGRLCNFNKVLLAGESFGVGCCEDDGISIGWLEGRPDEEGCCETDGWLEGMSGKKVDGGLCNFNKVLLAMGLGVGCCDDDGCSDGWLEG